MYYYVASYINSQISIHRESNEDEYNALCKLQKPLQEVEKHKKRFDSVSRAYDRITKIGDSLLGYSKDFDVEDFGNAISDYMFSFRKFLDTWETYIKRTFGEDSDLYRVFKKSTATAYEDHDEYKIVYQLRNADQHVDKVVDVISIGTNNDGTRYIQANANCSRLMKIYSKWKAVEKAHLQQHQSIDLFAYIKVAHACIIQIELDLVNYFMSEELYDSCCNILVKANEFFDNRKGIAFLCQEEEMTKEFWSRPSKILNNHFWMIPECIGMLETFLRNNIHVATILYHGKNYSLPLANVATELSWEQIERMQPGNKIVISGTPYLCYAVILDFLNQTKLVLAVNAAIPIREHENRCLRIKKYTNALLGKEVL